MSPQPKNKSLVKNFKIIPKINCKIDDNKSSDQLNKNVFYFKNDVIAADGARANKEPELYLKKSERLKVDMRNFENKNKFRQNQASLSPNPTAKIQSRSSLLEIKAPHQKQMIKVAPAKSSVPLNYQACQSGGYSRKTCPNTPKKMQKQHFEQDDSADPTTGPQTMTKEERERKDPYKDGGEED